MTQQNLKQKVDTLLEKYAPKIEDGQPVTAYVLVCGFCQQEYLFRLYQGNKLITEQTTPFQDRYYEIMTQGVCKPCASRQYKSLGIQQQEG